jgi:hypothetical protein
MDWKLALAQHPMYLLIREDTRCAERSPPWGLPSIELYIERVARNLAEIRKHPELKVGYEWSGFELELLDQDAPDVFREMCSLADEGQIAFYNGTYSQPHLQTLSSEANYRQFEYGAKVYRELCGHAVGTYAHQEASVHDQLPQLLEAFGIRFGLLPGFSSTLAWLDEGELVLFAWEGPRFVHGHEFVSWRGLDGTEIPLYLTIAKPKGDELEDFVAREIIAGRQRVPPIIFNVPDLIELDEEWLAKRRQFDIVLLDEALEERHRKYPPRARARLYSNWSYIEGIRAEELSRMNWRAELSALRAEALNALAFTLLDRPAEATDHVWKTILGTQHHDVPCFCGPELKEKSIIWLLEAERDAKRMADDAARAIIEQVDCNGGSGKPLVVFNTIPHAQSGLVTLDVEEPGPVVVDENGQVVPVEVVPTGDGNASRVRFLADVAGLGYQTYWIHGGGVRAAAQVCEAPLAFENEYFRATVQPNGTFTSLVIKPSGDELLDASIVRGNQLDAMDSSGLSDEYPGQGPGEKWLPTEPGPDLHWEPYGAPLVRHSALGTQFEVSGRIGSQTKATLAISFYHQLPRIDLTWTFTFETASIGTYYDDDTKLRIQWPLSFSGDIYHDIPFGVIQDRDERPFFPASWVDVCDGEKGLAYLHQGTPKHWVTEGKLANLFAWGEDTAAFNNRLFPSNSTKRHDQRLRGTQTIHCALYPHTGDWRTADVIGVARSYGTPPVAYLADGSGGELPTGLEILTLAPNGLAATAVRVRGSEVLCRLYSTAEDATVVGARASCLRPVGARSLGGEAITSVRPYQIAELLFERES